MRLTIIALGISMCMAFQGHARNLTFSDVIVKLMQLTVADSKSRDSEIKVKVMEALFLVKKDDLLPVFIEYLNQNKPLFYIEELREDAWEIVIGVATKMNKAW